MKLVASMIVAEVEVDRYLLPCLEHLSEFCEEVVLVPDGEWDTSFAWPGMFPWSLPPGVRVMHAPGVDFYAHEGAARQALLDLTLERDPTHILAIDADEFITDGMALRRAIQADPGKASWDLCMEEVWNTYPTHLDIRQDGGWAEHDVIALFAPQSVPTPLRMPDRALASGRVPQGLSALPRGCADASILHMGWANTAERDKRHARYVQHDGGRYHASAHLDSIMLPDTQITLSSRPWPEWTTRRIQSVLEAATRDAS